MIWDWIKQKFKNFFSSFKTTTIRASYDDDLFELLGEVDVYDEMENGEAVCGNCEDKITKNNLAALVKKDGQFIPICNKPSCLTVIK